VSSIALSAGSRLRARAAAAGAATGSSGAAEGWTAGAFSLVFSASGGGAQLELDKAADARKAAVRCRTRRSRWCPNDDSVRAPGMTRQ
jgi:hypothetical protein